MLLRDLYNDSIEEGVTTIFGKTGNKTVRKYRCTSGTRKGRIVAKPATCNAPKNMKASNTPVSYTHLRAHETDSYLVCRLLLEKM